MSRYLARDGVDSTGGADSEGRCLLQSLREIDKESTTVSVQLGHRLRMLARHVRACIVRVYTRRKFPPKPGVATTPANSDAMPLRRAFKRAHIAHSLSRDSQPRWIRSILPGRNQFPVSRVSISATRSLELYRAFIVAHFTPRSHCKMAFSSSLFLLSFPQRKVLPFKDSRVTCLSIKRRSSRMGHRKIILQSMRRMILSLLS